MYGPKVTIGNALRIAKEIGGSAERPFVTQAEENIRANDLVNYAKQLDMRERIADVGEALGQTWPVKMAKGIVGGVTAPGDAYQGRLDPTSDEAVQRALDLTGTVALGGMPLGYQVGKQAANEGKALLGIFAGAGAKTADLEALKRAQEMAASGASRDDIWSKTGWFQGADKNWRFEIPDNRAVYYYPPRGEDYPSYTEWVGDRLKHDELFRAYPQLADIQHESVPGINKNHMGSFFLGEKADLSDSVIGLHAPKGRLSTILHELQHAVQNQENFAKGANALMLKPNTPAWEIYQERIRAITKPPTLEEFAKGWGGTPQEAKKDYITHLKQLEQYKKSGLPTYLDRAAQDYAVEQAYRRAAGEVESRNVQTRMFMDDGERRAIPPWKTEDVQPDEQIVKFSTGGSVIDKALMVVSRQGLPLPKPPNWQHGGRP